MAFLAKPITKGEVPAKAFVAVGQNCVLAFTGYMHHHIHTWPKTLYCFVKRSAIAFSYWLQLAARVPTHCPDCHPITAPPQIVKTLVYTHQHTP